MQPCSVVIPVTEDYDASSVFSALFRGNLRRGADPDILGKVAGTVNILGQRKQYKETGMWSPGLKEKCDKMKSLISTSH